MAAVVPTPAPFSVLLCTLEQGEPLELDPQHPLASIRTQVGDGGVDRIHHLDDIDFWIGDTSAHTAPVNEAATALLGALLSAVAAGNYPASARERAHAVRVLSTRDGTPVVCGPCVVSGTDSQGSPTGLPDVFWAWFAATLAEGCAQAMVDRAAVILADLGIAADVIGFGPS